MTSNSTQKFYELNANNYFLATYSVNLDYLWKKFSKILFPDAQILDLGCGSGRDLRYFADQGFRAIGVDYSFNLIKLAKHLSNQPIISANFTSLPFTDKVFDGVWAVASLLHLPYQLIPATLLEIHRTLKPSSFLITSVKKGFGETIDSNGRYYRYYQAQEWEEVLLSNGYHILEFEETVEIRKVESGKTEEITWLGCLAQAV